MQADSEDYFTSNSLFGENYESMELPDPSDIYAQFINVQHSKPYPECLLSDGPFEKEASQDSN